MAYYFRTTLPKSFDDAVARTVRALKLEGFGIIADVDVQKTLREKIGVDFRNYRILGACIPQLAYEALQLEDKIGTMLPCNVVVQELVGGGVEVAAIDPVASMQPVDNQRLKDVAARVGEKLRRAIAYLQSEWPQDEAVVDEDGCDGVVVAETGAGKFQNAITAGRHRLMADEPSAAGGLDSGPGPYDYLAAALGACTSMTLRFYAEQNHHVLGRLTVNVKHGKLPVEHCDDCGKAAEGKTGKIDRFERVISVEGGVDNVMAERLIEIAGKCPIHRTLETQSAIVTKVSNDRTTPRAGPALLGDSL
jgi:uncharacterized OsmC-like protein/uncharacterized protein (DUF302 family)